MSIQKKSLISTLKTAKKAKVASAPLAHVEAGSTEVKLVKAQMAVRSGGRTTAMATKSKAFAIRNSTRLGKK